MKILILHGPNLNMLGMRDSALYGFKTLEEINTLLKETAIQLLTEIEIFQSNHEGELIDFIQKKSNSANGILINPGAFTHYSYALRDALEDTKLPIVEVHLTDLTKREAFRNVFVLDGIVQTRIMGLKEQSYIVGLTKLVSIIKNRSFKM